MSALALGRGFLIMLTTALAAAAAFYILQEHWAHALGLAPYLLFLACPLMHLFMHLFMHHGHKHKAAEGDPQRGRQDSGSGCH